MEKTYKIGGMHCAACAVGIEKFLGAQKGVESVSVNPATERMLIRFDEAQLAPEDIPQKLAMLSYTAADYIPPEQLAAEERRALAEREAAENRARVRRVVVCLCLAAPLLYVCLSHMAGGLLPLPGFLSPERRPLAYALAQLVLTVPILWLGRAFYTGGIPALLRRQPNMDSLVALGTGSAFFYSLYSLLRIAAGQPEYVHSLFFDSSAIVVTLVMLGKTLEASSRSRTGDAIRRLRELMPELATVTRYGVTADIPANELREGDAVTVQPGARFPCDGVVTEGVSSADLSMLTGESLPVPLAPGGEVTGGSVNCDGRILLRAAGVGEASRLAGIIRLVEDAQGRKAPIAKLADRLAGVFVPVVLGIAVLAALVWAVAGKDASFVLNVFVSVLVIACPCSLGLATPTAILCGTGRGAELGILFRSGEALQALAGVDCAALDKTGTLTEGRPAVRTIQCFQGSEDELLTLAAAAEAGSKHPVAAAIRLCAEERGLTLPEARDAAAIPGLGVRAVVDGRAVLVGSAELMRQNGVVAQEGGGTEMFCAADGVCLGRFEAEDSLRPDSAAAVAALHALGIQTVMLTGDNEAAARSMAARVGIDAVEAGILPGGKAERVRALKAEGRRVAMVGDGINDAPALAEADVGVAIGSGTDVAVESADVILTSASLDAAARAVRLSRAVLRNIRENLFWAFLYNVCGIPFAAGLVYAFGGPLLNPMFAGAAMALSSICVVLNALRLKRWDR